MYVYAIPTDLCISIYCFSISDTGEGSFRFLSEDAEIILKYIGQCIKMVIAQKQQQRQQQAEQMRNRAVSVSKSEYHYRAILENSKRSIIERSVSETSSLSSTPPKSPTSLPASPPINTSYIIPSDTSFQDHANVSKTRYEEDVRSMSLPVSPTTASTVVPSGTSFKEHNAIFRTELNNGEVNSSDRPVLQSNSPPVTRHSSESALTNRKQQQMLMEMNSKPRTQSFTLMTAPISMSLRDSGIILQDGDGKQQTERIRRKSTEVRHGSNSFDSAVSTGSCTEEVRVGEAIREEPTTTQTIPTLPGTPLPMNSQQPPFMVNPLSPSNTYPCPVTTMSVYPPTVMQFATNEQQLQSTAKPVVSPVPAYPATSTPLSSSNQQLPITSCTILPCDAYPGRNSTSPTYPTTVPLSVNSYQTPTNSTSSLSYTEGMKAPTAVSVYPSTVGPLSTNAIQRERSASQSLQNETAMHESVTVKEQRPRKLQFKEHTTQSPRLPPRNPSPVSTNSDISIKSAPDLPPPRKKTPPSIKHQHSNSDISQVKLQDATIPKSELENIERKSSPTADSQINPIYHDIDDHTAGNSDQKVRRHSTGELPKENVYEELKSISKKNSKHNYTITVEVPPELPDRPATLRYRPKHKDEQQKRRTALPNLFISKDQQHGTIRGMNVGDSSTHLTETLSRSSSKDIYSSISSDLESETLETKNHQPHSEASSKNAGAQSVSTTNMNRDIIDLFPPSVCDWIKAGGQKAPSPVADLMGFDIPSDFTANVATPTCLRNQAPVVKSPVDSVPSITTKPTASVTDWAIVSGTQASSDASFETFFSERTIRQTENWANFDDFEPNPSKEGTDHTVNPVDHHDQESAYIDMTARQPKTPKHETSDVENPSNNEIPSDANTEHIYAAPGDALGGGAAYTDTPSLGTNVDSLYVAPGDIATTDGASLTDAAVEHIYVSPDELHGNTDVTAVNNNDVIQDTKADSVHVAPDALNSGDP